MGIYTKTGDGGTTSLIGGERVPKNDPRVEAYGTVDELSAHLGLLADMMRAEENAHGGAPHGRSFGEIPSQVIDIQRDLIILMSCLASGKNSLPADAVSKLERQIDKMSENLPPAGGFIIPGGHPIVSQSHICRTVCRRAERRTVTASESYPLPSATPVEYLNRLSDWLYVVGRKALEILK